MPTLTIEYQTEAERLIPEQARAFCAQMRHVGATAPDGTVPGALAAVTDGKAGIERWIADRFGELPPESDGDALRDRASYLAAHPTRSGYARGRPAVGASAAGSSEARSSSW